MFYFWRGATAALVPGFLCQSGRRRPENDSILSSLMLIDGTLIASPQTSFGVPCHARDKRTPKDVFGEASLSDLPKILSCTERGQGWNRDGDEIANSKRIHTM